MVLSGKGQRGSGSVRWRRWREGIGCGVEGSWDGEEGRVEGLGIELRRGGKVDD